MAEKYGQLLAYVPVGQNKKPESPQERESRIFAPFCAYLSDACNRIMYVLRRRQKFIKKKK